MDEIRQSLERATAGPLFSELADDLLSQAAEAMSRVGRLADADAAEIERAREALHKVKETESPLEAMLDVLAASRLEPGTSLDPGVLQAWRDDLHSIPGSRLHQQAQHTLAVAPPFHFATAFPDVFKRERPGFDVIIGNPPWEEASLEEDDFWTRVWPGLQGLRQHEREELKGQFRGERPDLVRRYNQEVAEAALVRQVLVTGPYPGMGIGDPDFYKAFCWRFWHLVRKPGGRIGVVLPRSVWSVKGSQLLRKTVFTDGRVLDLTFVLNSGGWVFDDAEPCYTIALTCLEASPPLERTMVPLRGPYRNLARFIEGTKKEPIRFPVSEVMGWTDTTALPLLPTEEAVEVFAQLRKSPRLDLNDRISWRACPYRELDATNDKRLMLFTDKPPKDYWPVFKGESFDIWQNDTGHYYAWANPRVLLPAFQEKRMRAARNRRSPFSEMPSKRVQDRTMLPCLHPRIAFRDVSRATDTRTVRAALLPPRIAVTNTGPYLLWPQGDEKDQAFLLGVLCSISLDWYARRFVETHLNYHILKALSIPRPLRSDALWARAVALAGRLACPDDRFDEWARVVGVQCGPIPEDQKLDMIHELDAVVAHLYGLSESQLRHIFETFHEGWQFGPRMVAALKHYHAWKSRL